MREGAKLIVILFLIEVALQLFAPHYRNQVFDHEFTAGHAIDVQPAGNRGEPVRVARMSENEFRIVALGDSATFGTSVASEATWPAQLEQILDAGSDRPVTAINTAVPAASVDQLRVAYEEQWRAYDPDVIILAVSNNMISLAWIRRDDDPHPPRNEYLTDESDWSLLRRAKIEANRLGRKLCLPSFLTINADRMLYFIGLQDHRIDPEAPYGPLLAFGFEQGGVSQALIDNAWTQFEADLLQLRDRIEADGRRLIVTYVPARFTLSETGRDNEKHVPLERITIDPNQRIASICAERGMAFVDIASALREHRHDRARAGAFAPLYVLFDYVHLNENGLAVVARALADAVVRGE